MSQSIAYTVYPVNENTLTILLGDTINQETSHNIFRIYNQLIINRHVTWLDIIPAYATISIVYDVVKIRKDHPSAFDWITQKIDKILKQPYSANTFVSRKITIPVCYDEAYALDRKTILSYYKLSWDEVVSIHSSKTYQVFMIGFLPGFAYMGTVDQRIAFPRLSKPRTLVSAGSVGIAGEQTGIYPLDSPGGWNIIGKTPLTLFDTDSENPVLLQPHDTVRFVPISKKEFNSFDKSGFNPVSA